MVINNNNSSILLGLESLHQQTSRSKDYNYLHFTHKQTSEVWATCQDHETKANITDIYCAPCYVLGTVAGLEDKMEQKAACVLNPV